MAKQDFHFSWNSLITFSITLITFAIVFYCPEHSLKFILKTNLTRETINVLTIAVIHYFSWWSSSEAFLIDSKYIKWQDYNIFTKLVLSHSPSKSSHQRCSEKKVFLKLREISRKKSVLESLLNKFAGQ